MNTALDFGIFQMPEVRPERNWTLYFDQIVQEARLAEDLGFDEYWVGEHHTKAHETVPDPLMMLSRIAEATERIRLGPATVNLTYEINDPFNVAEKLAFLDQLSNGRANYGFGAGALPRDMAMFNVDEERQKDIMWEAIDVIETYTDATELTDFDGEFFQYEDRIVQLPPLQEEPPTAVAGFTSTGSYSGAIEGGHRPLTLPFSPLSAPDNPDALGLKRMGETIDEAATSLGRDPQAARREWSIARDVYVTDSKEQALEEIREGAEEYYDYMLGLGDGGLLQFVKTDPEQTRDDLTVEWLVENLPMIVGSPDECIKQISALHQEVGGFGTLIVNSHDWMLPEQKWRDSLELFAQEVMPAFQSRKGPREIEKEQVPGYEPVELAADEDPFAIDSSKVIGTGD
ncbi:LLM class flavin-dependent oxidoreductase [Natrinema caseinilyticum]|uniref:LLM class flavin-dependent oxidoreductase n=1 Tax=Natrinema caseinilyticum TaxID=2961570 RepID=UPI0020C578EA|nr:LLM class flavin-dependent oxidoreductase [Natrinema caseinilyticum]